MESSKKYEYNSIEENKLYGNINQSNNTDENIIEIFCKKNGIKEKLKKIGKGGFSNVYCFIKNGLKYAIKIINSKHEKFKANEDKYRKKIETEVMITKNLYSKYTVKMFGFQSFECKSIGIIQEFYENIDLSLLNEFLHSPKMFKYSTKIKEKKKYYEEKPKKKKGKKDNKSIKNKSKFKYEEIENSTNQTIKIARNQWYEKPSESLIRYFVDQIYQSMYFLHSAKIVHMDIKLENFFLSNNFTIKLGDFFLSQVINPTKEYLLEGIGTINYMSPDYFFGNNNFIDGADMFKMDYFAIGISILFLMTNRNFIDDSQNKDINRYNQLFENNFKNKQAIKENFLKDFNYALSDELFELLKGLLQPNIKQRFNLEDFKNNKWLEKDMDSIKYYYQMNLGDYIKYMTELQKIEHSYFMKNKMKNEKLFLIDLSSFEIIYET